jgi:hypothetical protein
MIGELLYSLGIAAFFGGLWFFIGRVERRAKSDGEGLSDVQRQGLRAIRSLLPWAILAILVVGIGAALRGEG